MQHQRRKEFLVQHKAVRKRNHHQTRVEKNFSFNVIIDETNSDVASLRERIQISSIQLVSHSHNRTP